MIRLISCIAACTLMASPAAAVVTAFTGTIVNDTEPPMPSALCAPTEVRVVITPENSTQNTTSNFGSFGITQAHCIQFPPTSYSGGVFSFAFLAGDILSGTYSGFFTPTGTPNILNTTVNFVATGGTGRFAGATGAIQGVGILDRSLPRPLNSLTLNGSLDVGSVPEPAMWGMMILGFGAIGASVRRRRTATAALA